MFPVADELADLSEGVDWLTGSRVNLPTWQGGLKAKTSHALNGSFVHRNKVPC